MKKVIILICSMFVFNGFSQIPRALEIPKKSQKSSTMQRVGFTDIVVNYHSPATRGRKVWGNARIMPKGGKPFPWRAGANENTTISFSDSVRIEGKKMAAGIYGFHVIAAEDDVTIIFSKNTTSWGSFFYDKNEDVLRVTVKKEKIPHREWLTYDFEIREKNHVVLSLKWGEYKIPFKIEVDVLTTLNHIKQQLRSDAAFTPDGWYNAASYCLNNNMNYTQGLDWIDRALNNEKTFNNYLVKAQLLLKTEQTEKFNEVKKELIASATAYEAYSYIYRYRKKDALKIIEELNDSNLKKNPKTWESNYAAGLYFSYKKLYKKADKYYKRALKYTGGKGNVKKAILRAIEKNKTN